MSPSNTDLLLGTLDVFTLKVLALQPTHWPGASNLCAKFCRPTLAGLRQFKHKTDLWGVAAATARALEVS
jgi:hypothetical protein